MEKNGMSEWIRLMQAATGRGGLCSDADCAFRGINHDTYECQLPSAHAFAAEKLMEMLYCPSIIKAVVVRDPLERLLSAYLDKCAFSHVTKVDAMPLISHCQGFYANELKTSINNRVPRRSIRVPRFSEFVDKLYRTRNRSSTWDTHFRPQHMHCGLGGRKDMPSLLPFVHYHLHMSDQSFHSNLDILFRHVGFSSLLRMEYFPNRSNSTHRTSANTQLARYYTPLVARQALEIYAEDYDLFSLTIPLGTPLAVV